MVVIADTSPLNYLLLISKADVLPALYGKVVIPPAVRAELLHPKTPRTVADWIASPPAWLILERNVTPLPDSVKGLDSGEREAIAIAEANKPDVLLVIDEERGRQEAERRNIQTTGTLGILAAAAAAGLLDLRPTLRRLQATNFYVSDRLIQRLLDRNELGRKSPR